MEKILVVNMNYLGDALMTTPALAALRSAHPEARIDTIAGATNGYSAAYVLRMNPDIDEVIPRVAGGAMARCWQLARILRSGRYQAVVVLPSIPAYNTTARLSGTAVRVNTPQLEGRVHLADHLLEAVQPLTGDTAQGKRLVLQVPPDAQESARRRLAALPHRGAPIIAVNVGATRPQKRWPREHFVSLAKLLAREKNIVLLGGPVQSDQETAERVRESVGAENILDLTGQTTIAELAGVIATCDALVTADTGAMHIASAVGTPQVALFGSTDPAVTGPYGASPARVIYKSLSCAPCGKHPTCAGRYDCLQSIEPEEVMLALKDLLRTRRAVSLPVAALG
jgi:ADP-heptose:LPS heptosyltransferase